MGRGLIATGLAALALAAPAWAGLPLKGLLVPGVSLGGVRLGESAVAVRATLGTFYGRCNDCARPTWYFTVAKFDKHGLAVEFTGRRVSAVYTLWEPAGWRSTDGLRLGASPLAVHRHVGFIQTFTCPGYEALVDDSRKTRTAYYLYNGSLWGFGLFRPADTPCR
jgi:hypothetical protein